MGHVRVEGKLDVLLCLAGFRTRSGSLAGLELFSWFAFTRGVDPQLEITGVDLLGPVETGSDPQPDGPASDRLGISR